MRHSSQVKPISYLKAHAAEVLSHLADRRAPLVITHNGEATAVLQDVASYEQTRETLALLKILALGQQEPASIDDTIAGFDCTANANYVLDPLMAAADSLAKFPERGNFPKALAALGIKAFRQRLFKPYRVIYRVIATRVVI